VIDTKGKPSDGRLARKQPTAEDRNRNRVRHVAEDAIILQNGAGAEQLFRIFHSYGRHLLTVSHATVEKAQ
jgi:hypothetical protein